MSGLLALLDDVAMIARMAATSLDDVAAQAAKAGSKAAGAVIDDAAVAPQYVQGLDAARELPMVWRIAVGSLRNKLVILLPGALLLSAFAPWAIVPLLMLGGGYLSYEGAHKVWHWALPGPGGGARAGLPPAGTASSPTELEEARVAGAIKTDFILSAEITTIALSAIPEADPWTMALTLGVVGVAMTVLVYGSVALIVKADDLGLLLARHGRLRLGRRLGRWLVEVMPGFLSGLVVVGTLAMLWVGGSIVLHGLASLGWGAPMEVVEAWAEQAAEAAPAELAGAVAWVAGATLSGVFGLALGLVLLPVGKWLTATLARAWRALRVRGH